MWLMLQQDEPEDYIMATGVTTTVRDFVTLAFGKAGIALRWEGSGADERGVDTGTGKILVQVDPRYYRPAEVDILIGDASKARERLGWKPKVGLDELVSMMVASDIKDTRREVHLREGGFSVLNYYE